MSRPIRPAHALGAMATAALASGAAWATYRALRRQPPGRPGTWDRTNHRGEPVTLLEGPAVAAGAILAAAASPSPALPLRVRAALAVAGAGAAAFGAYDDLAGSGDKRGFRGHLGALAKGEVTTGAVKIGGIGATGLAAGALLGGSPVDVALNAALTAGTANLLNLFDLRPGRAIKVAAASGALIAAAGGETAAVAVSAPLGAALALLPEDLGERAMLGDSGANALGAMLGVAAGATMSRPARLAMLGVVVGLTAASERVSFTKVIERTPALRWLDMLGRRPPASAVPVRPQPAARIHADGSGQPEHAADAGPATSGGGSAGGSGAAKPGP
ncbi:MAG TPA: hypothetical protein VGS19_10505 [Streptosporangiaceae bacterium]|nr:hypothetical protein [Streptosporangiaceae bacterium]